MDGGGATDVPADTRAAFESLVFLALSQREDQPPIEISDDAAAAADGEASSFDDVLAAVAASAG